MSDPFAASDVTNAILVLETMKVLHIKGVRLLDTTSSKGMLIREEYGAATTV